MDNEELIEAIFQRDLKIKNLKEENKVLSEKIKLVKEIAGSSFSDNAIYKIQELLEE